MFKALSLVEPVLYFAAFVFATVKATQEIRVALTESKPTIFAAEKFSSEYDGQQWIGVRGRVATEHKFVRISNHQAHQGKNLAYVSIPIVPRDWRPEQPFHVIATFGPMNYGTVEGWAKRWDRPIPSAIKGRVRPGGFRDPASMFPGTQLGEPLVVINEGTEPNHIGSMTIFLVMMFGAGWLTARKIRQMWRGRE